MTLTSILGRSFRHHSFLTEASNEVISINPYRDTIKSPDYEGKLIHLTGQLKTLEALGETSYNILVQAVKLRKIVELYQWHEDYTENKFAPDEGDTRNYYYYKEWSESLIDSRSFHSLSHQNPRKKPMESKIVTAEKAYIGGFEICDEAKDMFNSWIDITSDTRPDDYFIKMHGGAYYHTEDLFELQIGDMRVRFQLAGLEGDIYTIVGKFHQGKIVPFLIKGKRKILLLSKGKLSKEEIFHQEHKAISKELWFTRLFGFILILFFVHATENLTRIIYTRTRFSFLIVNPQKQLRSYLKISIIYTVFICVLRQGMHYCGIL